MLPFSFKICATISFKAVIKRTINTSIFKTNLPSLTSVPLLPSFSNSFALIFLKGFEIHKIVQKWNIFARNDQSSNQEMFAISLSSCSRYNANFKFDQSVSAIHDSPPYFWDHWGWPPTETSLVTHARDHWWPLDFANAFVSPGVNSRGELIPSPRAYARNGAPRRWLRGKTPAHAVNITNNKDFGAFLGFRRTRYL
jgi:hypothetical protein